MSNASFSPITLCAWLILSGVLFSAPAELPTTCTGQAQRDWIDDLLKDAEQSQFPAPAALATLLQEHPRVDLDVLLRLSHAEPPTIDREKAAALRVALGAIPRVFVQWSEARHSDNALLTDIGQKGLTIVSSLGDASGLAASLVLGAPLRSPEQGSDSWPLYHQLSHTVDGLLEKDPDTYRAIRSEFSSIGDDLRALLIERVGAQQNALGLHLLIDLLPRGAQLDPLILSQITVCARTVRGTSDTHALSQLRRYLGSSDATESSQAALCVGWLSDDDAIPELIGLLTSEHRGVQSNAHWALQRITSMLLGPEAGHWRVWYRSETGWWSKRAHEVLHELYSPERHRVVAAINELSSKRLFRDELTSPLTELLINEDPVLARMACSALGNLRAPGATFALTEALDYQDEGVKAQAWRALKRITGRSLPPERRTWRNALRKR